MGYASKHIVDWSRCICLFLLIVGTYEKCMYVPIVRINLFRFF